MNPSTRITVVLDACVLYPAPVRDILLSLAAEGLFNPKWTNQIQEEWVINLIENRKDLSRAKLNPTIQAMNNAFTDANIVNFEHLIPTLTLPDKNDRHVLAAAIRCNADLIITFNLKDFPTSELQKYNVEVQSPDILISDLIDLNLELCCIAFSKMIKRLRKPIKTKRQIIEILLKCGLKLSAAKLNNCP